MKNDYVIGTRGSRLALIQTTMVAEALRAAWPTCTFTIKEITTQGDIDRKTSLEKIGGKGIFVKELERQLLAGDIDFAVHSLKDVMPRLPENLMISAIPKRESPYDCLITRTKVSGIDELPSGARVGTGSSRRMGQLRHYRPDLQPVSIRGNVETRVNLVRTGEVDAIVIAEAGLNRLDLHPTDLFRVTVGDFMLPAVGQGAMAIECRTDDPDVQSRLAVIDDPETHACVHIERDFLRTVGGDCTNPIGGFAVKTGTDQYHFDGLITSIDGTQVFTDQRDGTLDDHLGQKAATTLIEAGALGAMEEKD
ncbi:hydroxymethylbilane synthase [Furfurilactobacillus sp. WILCCON 0119]